MRTISTNGHTITVEPIGTKAKITYDGAVVSEPTGRLSATGVFNVTEDGQNVQYVVEMKSRLLTIKVTIRRNGMIIYSD